MDVHVGIDPGYERTGVVIEGEGDQLFWATYSCKSNKGLDFFRAIALADSISEFICETVSENYSSEEVNLFVSVELPVYTQNPLVFTKQVRLLQEIENEIALQCDTYFKTVMLYEINPIQSKHALTDNAKADKKLMVQHSPFNYGQFDDIGDDADVEALADAYGHMVAGKMKKYYRYIDVSASMAPLVEIHVAGGK